MSKFVEFESVEGVRIAINPRAVTMVSSIEGSDIVYIRTSNGEEMVRGSFRAVIDELSLTDEVTKRTILKEDTSKEES